MILICSPSLYALSLNGNRLSPIIFEPGKKIVNHYLITDTNKQVNLSLAGDLLQYIHVSEVINNQFDLIIDAPQNLPEPGSYSFTLHATEMSNPESSGVSSFVSVNLRYLVEVPPHGKSISISLEVPDLNEHQEVPFSVNVISKGLENISSLQGTITVYDLQNHSMATLNLQGEPLRSLESATLAATLPADTLLPATYWAEAIINYDGKSAQVSDHFKIGNLNLILVNYTSQLEPQFALFQALVENNWGNPIKIAYAKIFINGTELLTTPTIYLEPWQRGELKGILKTDFAPGNYNGLIELFYDDQSRQENVTFSILPSPSESLAGNYLAVAIIIILLVLATFIIIFVHRRNKK